MLFGLYNSIIKNIILTNLQWNYMPTLTPSTLPIAIGVKKMDPLFPGVFNAVPRCVLRFR
jgi:hypothetical protein